MGLWPDQGGLLMFTMLTHFPYFIHVPHKPFLLLGSTRLNHLPLLLLLSQARTCSPWLEWFLILVCFPKQKRNKRTGCSVLVEALLMLPGPQVSHHVHKSAQTPSPYFQALPTCPTPSLGPPPCQESLFIQKHIFLATPMGETHVLNRSTSFLPFLHCTCLT